MPAKGSCRNKCIAYKKALPFYPKTSFAGSKPLEVSKGAKMNANPKFLSATATVDEAAIQPLPNSSKVYIQGSRPDIRVPMRKITQADTAASFGAEKNPPIYVYDTSGPYPDQDEIGKASCRERVCQYV